MLCFKIDSNINIYNVNNNKMWQSNFMKVYMLLHESLHESLQFCNVLFKPSYLSVLQKQWNTPKRVQMLHSPENEIGKPKIQH